MSRTISYKGRLADGGQDTINLHTNDGKTGYKIVDFRIFQQKPGTLTQESTVQIFSVKQTTVSTTAVDVDFSDITLLAAAALADWSDRILSEDVVVFDNMIFNQDIYITHTETAGTAFCNYYIELEQMDLTEDQALVAIVKNLRNEQ